MHIHKEERFNRFSYYYTVSMEIEGQIQYFIKLNIFDDFFLNQLEF